MEGKKTLLSWIVQFKLKSKKISGYGMKPKKSETKESSTVSETSEMVFVRAKKEHSLWFTLPVSHIYMAVGLVKTL